jgi:NAD(P)-dependent dehydrogenase (short-subunit alcohol dehydrogenase family)
VVPFHQVITAEGFDLQLAVNHLAPFLLTHLLFPLLSVAPGARVVTVSSGSHYGVRLNWDDIQLRRNYFILRAYKQTKLCNVLFMAELNRRLGGVSGLRGFAADPGLVNTNMGSKSNSALVRWVWGVRRRSGISPGESAKGISYLLCEPSIPFPDAVYWKHGKPKVPDASALDPEAARKLWELSAGMCGFDPADYGKSE